MLLYLLCLLLASIGIELSQAVTLFMTTLVGCAMLRLNEVSQRLEQPFRLMPLYQLSKGLNA
jgi:predicted membrane chloride channel (bestrophin family)